MSYKWRVAQAIVSTYEATQAEQAAEISDLRTTLAAVQAENLVFQVRAAFLTDRSLAVAARNTCSGRDSEATFRQERGACMCAPESACKPECASTDKDRHSIMHGSLEARTMPAS